MTAGPAPIRRPRGRPRKDASGSGLTRSLLVEAAEEAFVELGYDGVTVGDIVRRAGFTSGAMYNHFAGKADLLIEVVKRALDRIAGLAQRVAHSDSLAETLPVAVRAWFDIPAADRLMLAEVHLAASRHADVAALLQAAITESMAGMRDQIVADQRRGAVNPGLDPERLARIVTVLFAGLNHVDTIDPDLANDEVAKSYFAEWAAQLLLLQVPPPTGRVRRLSR